MSVLHRSIELLEPYDGKLSCTVLRGERGSNTPDLPDKEYYNALKSVHNLVKDARKVQKSILLIGEISDIYVNSFQKMLSDENYTPDELSAIAYGYTQLLQESSDVLEEMKSVVNINGLSMSDKERMDVIDRTYNAIRNYRDLVSYYTRKNISVSYLRAKKKKDTDRVMALYGSADERYW